MKETYRQIISGLAASMTLMGFWVGTDFVIWFNLIIAAAIGLGVYFSIPKKKEPHEIEVAPGVTQAQLDNVLHVIDTYTDKFSEFAKASPKKDIADAIGEIVTNLQAISNRFNEEPQDLRNASVFFDQYLVRSYDIISNYVRLTQKSLQEHEMEKLKPVENTIKRITTGFQDLYRQCLCHDLTELEVKSEAFKAILEVEEEIKDMLYAGNSAQLKEDKI